METNDLREILALAEKRSYAATADALFISPSSLSRHIAAVEQQLGAPLFYRNSRSVMLTSYGEMLLPYARKITELEDEYLEKLDQARRSDRAGLRIGAFFRLSAHGIMSQIARFLGENREISLEIQSDANDRLLDLLRRGKCDLAFVQEEGPSAEDGLSRLTVGVDTLAAALPADHILAGAESVRLSQLREEPFVPQPPQTIQSRLAADAFRRAGYVPKQTRLAVSGVGVLELVEQGLGIALVQAKLARERLCPGVVLVPLDPPERIWINLVWSPDGLSEIGKSLISFFRGSAAGKMPQK
ncbi:MAG: LysR family transcriptional regulator [Oscillospiraceae bacterium]